MPSISELLNNDQLPSGDNIESLDGVPMYDSSQNKTVGVPADRFIQDISGGSGGTSYTENASDYVGSTSDGGSAIQAAINNLPSGGGNVVVPAVGPDSGSVWSLSSTITIPDNTTVVLNGAEIFLQGGVDDNVFRNDDGTNGNQNIGIVGTRGSRIDNNGRNQNRAGNNSSSQWLGIKLFNVDKFVVGGFEYFDSAAWAIKAENVTRGQFLPILWDNAQGTDNQDGIHIQGPSNSIEIHPQEGECDDDMVAIGCHASYDFSDSSVSAEGNGGNTHDVTVHGVDNSAHNACRLLTGDNQMYDINIQYVSTDHDTGTDGNWGIHITDEFSSNGVGTANDVRDISLGTVVNNPATPSQDNVRCIEVACKCASISIDKIIGYNSKHALRVAPGQNFSSGVCNVNVGSIVQRLDYSSAVWSYPNAVYVTGGSSGTVNINNISYIFEDGLGSLGGTQSALSLDDNVEASVNVNCIIVDDKRTSGVESQILGTSGSFGSETNAFVYIGRIVAPSSLNEGFTIRGISQVVLGDITVNSVNNMYNKLNASIKFTGDHPPHDSAPPNVLGSKVIASSTWDPDGDGSGEYVMGDGANWNKIADLPNI